MSGREPNAPAGSPGDSGELPRSSSLLGGLFGWLSPFRSGSRAPDADDSLEYVDVEQAPLELQLAEATARQAEAEQAGEDAQRRDRSAVPAEAGAAGAPRPAPSSSLYPSLAQDRAEPRAPARAPSVYPSLPRDTSSSLDPHLMRYRQGQRESPYGAPPTSSSMDSSEPTLNLARTRYPAAVDDDSALFHAGSVNTPQQPRLTPSASRTSGRKHRPIYFGPGMASPPRSARRPLSPAHATSGMSASRSLGTLGSPRALTSPRPAFDTLTTPDSLKRRRMGTPGVTDASPVRFAEPSPLASQKRSAATSLVGDDSTEAPSPARSNGAEPAPAETPRKSLRIEPDAGPSRAASAMLSVLKDSEPLRSSSSVPEVVNPYQRATSPKRATRVTASPRTTRARAALEAARKRAAPAKPAEPERPRDGSLLELVERTEPQGRRHSPRLAAQASEPAQPAPAPAPAPEPAAPSHEAPELAPGAMLGVPHLANKPKRPSPLAATAKAPEPAAAAPAEPAPEPAQQPQPTPFTAPPAAPQPAALPSAPATPKDLLLELRSAHPKTYTDEAKKQASQVAYTELPTYSFSVAPVQASDVSALIAQAPADKGAPASGKDTGAAKPAASAFSFGGAKPSTESKPEGPVGLFSFGGTANQAKDKPADKPAEKPAGPSSPFAFGAQPGGQAGKPTPTSPFTFGAKSDGAGDKAAAPSSPFSFGAKAGESAKDKPAGTSPFSFGKADDAAKDKPSPFFFGKADDAAKGKPAGTSAFSFGKADDGAKDKPAGTSPFSFGKADDGAKDKPASPFSFGGTKPSASPFSFGAGQTDAGGKPPGSAFSFSQPKDQSTEAPKSNPFSLGQPTEAAKPAFSFSFSGTPAPPAPAPANESAGSGGAGEEAQESTEAKEPSSEAKEPSAEAKETGSTFATGEGEEGEDTLHEARTKLWKLAEGKWQDLGVCNLKLKKRQDSNKVRVLARNAVNGSVALNFFLYKALKVTQDKNVLTFLGFEDAKPCNLRCKVKTNDGAQELKEALETHAQTQ